MASAKEITNKDGVVYPVTVIFVSGCLSTPLTLQALKIIPSGAVKATLLSLGSV